MGLAKKPAPPHKANDRDGHHAFVLIHPNDNILVCCSAVIAGHQITLDGAIVTLPHHIDVGHKIARIPLATGHKVVRHGVPIGSMSEAAEIGTHIHIHNMQSDYIPSHGRDAVHIEEERA